jgi:cytochrome c-type biogenesis protein CcmF
MLPLVFVLGIGPLTRWKGDDAGRVARLLRVAFVASLVIAIAIVLVTAGYSPLLLAALTIAIWAITTTLVGVLLRVRSKPDIWQGLRALPRGFVGMSLAHVGVGIFIIGVAFTTSFSTDRDVRLGRIHHLLQHRSGRAPGAG